jgi:hypothetical protein
VLPKTRSRRHLSDQVAMFAQIEQAGHLVRISSQIEQLVLIASTQV